MGRPPVFSPETKSRIVLSVLSGEVSIAEAARKEKVSEQSIGRRKAEFLEAGKTALAAGRSGPSTCEEQLEAQVQDLTQALVRMVFAPPGVEEVGGGPVGPFEDLEVIRTDAGMSTARFCELFGIPERSWRRWQARARAGQPVVKGPWPAPAREQHRQAVVGLAGDHPAWDHRKIWAMARHDGHRVSQSTVRRIFDEEGRLLKADYQRERRRLAQARKAAFADPPTGPNQVWQFDFSEFVTTGGGTWRVAAVADYWSKYEFGWHWSPTANQHATIAGVEIAPVETERLYREQIHDASDLVREAEAHRVQFNTVRPRETLSWNRPADVYRGLTEPTTPTFPEPENLPEP